MQKHESLKRSLSLLLCLCMLFTSVGPVVFAENSQTLPAVVNVETAPKSPALCELGEGCTLPAGHEDECVLPAAEEPKLCDATEGCTLPAGHEGECVLPVTEDLQQAPPDQSSGPYRVGDVFYSDLDDALDDLRDGEVLEILEDVEWDSYSIELPQGSVTVTSAKADGTKATITMSRSFYLYNYSGATITFKNINIDCNENTLQVSTGATVILDTVYFI